MMQNTDTIGRKYVILVGAAVCALSAILHAREFRLDAWSPAAIAAWCGLSLLVGGVIGLITGRLAGFAPAWLPRLGWFGVAAVLAVIGYLLQVSVLLSIVFRMVEWE